ncbi:MAG: hypothetical protein OXU73_02870 [Candidatus Campbellbacteria bacterium]|nr:hypothetical protein [Candidatus Campbellbacteria bacterium]
MSHGGEKGDREEQRLKLSSDIGDLFITAEVFLAASQNRQGAESALSDIEDLLNGNRYLLTDEEIENVKNRIRTMREDSPKDIMPQKICEIL